MSNTKAHWESIYKDKSPVDVSWYQKKPELSLQLIRKILPDKDGAIIDVGGGASLLVDYLVKGGFSHLSVLDISNTALAFARDRIGGISHIIEWYESDITHFDPPHKFSLWHDRAVFHFLTNQSDRKNYVKVLKNSLITGGHAIIATFAIGGPEKCSGLDIVQYDAHKLAVELGREFILIEKYREMHITPANTEQMFVYFLFSYHPRN